MAQQILFQISNSKEKKCLTIFTREVNELGPGKFRTSAENGWEQTCYFNRDKSDSYFTSSQTKRVSLDNLFFDIVKLNSDFNLTNKSLEIDSKNSLMDRISNRQHQSVNREYSENRTEPGKTSGSETSTDIRGDNGSLQSEPTLRGGKHRGQSDRNSSAEQSTRKKPRFLSD